MKRVGSVAITTMALWLHALSGPPVLPPLPGERPESEADPPATAESKPSTPTRPSTPPEKPTPPPAAPPAPAETDPAGTEPPAERPEGSFSIPVQAEPPQPEPVGPPPEGQDTKPPAAEDKPAADGPTAAPRIGELDSELPATVRLELPPPSRPPYRGTGLFIGAGVTFAIALTEQIIGHRLVKRRCIDPIGRGEFDTSEDVGDVVAGCAPGVLPAIALRVHSDLGLLATIGLATAGAMTRANSEAYAHVFDTQRRRQVAGLRIGGLSLLGAGVVTWLTTGATAWGILGNCGSARCANGARLMAFITRDVSVAMIASGAGMLAFAEVYRRRHDGYTRDRALSIGPAVSRGTFGLSATGRF